MFLLGMKLMSEGLEKATGSQLEYVLKKVSSNKYIAVITGTIITAIIQSSSAISVILIGFVNARLMSLKQTMWIIMGANIGTTITSQLMAIDIGKIAPLFIVIGLLLLLGNKKESKYRIGEIVIGLGMLFMAMDLMAYAMTPLQQSKMAKELFINLNNPILGVLVGSVFTALIQSSSASVGILQTLAIQGLVPLSSAIWIVYGQNIGTCITACIASYNGCRNAKRLTIIHILINVLGMMFFIPVCYLLPILPLIQQITPNNPAMQIANLHTIFNIFSTLVLLPIDRVLITISYWILPKKVNEV